MSLFSVGIWCGQTNSFDATEGCHRVHDLEVTTAPQPIARIKMSLMPYYTAPDVAGERRLYIRWSEAVEISNRSVTRHGSFSFVWPTGFD